MLERIDNQRTDFIFSPSAIEDALVDYLIRHGINAPQASFAFQGLYREANGHYRATWAHNYTQNVGGTK